MNVCKVFFSSPPAQNIWERNLEKYDRKQRSVMQKLVKQCYQYMDTTSKQTGQSLFTLAVYGSLTREYTIDMEVRTFSEKADKDFNKTFVQWLKTHLDEFKSCIYKSTGLVPLKVRSGNGDLFKVENGKVTEKVHKDVDFVHWTLDISSFEKKPL